MNAPDSTFSLNPGPTRIGKIARLPWVVRQAVNERLEENQPGPRLLAWLNSLPEVRKVLAEQFGGRPILQQNLSAWKLGGFRAWQRVKAIRAFTRNCLEEARGENEEHDEAKDRLATSTEPGKS